MAINPASKKILLRPRLVFVQPIHLGHLSFSSIPAALQTSLTSTPSPQPRPQTTTPAPTRATASAANPGTSGASHLVAPGRLSVSPILRNLRPVPRDSIGTTATASRPPPSLVRPLVPRLVRPAPANPAASVVVLTARKFRQPGSDQEGYFLVCPPRVKIRDEHLGQVREQLLQLVIRTRTETSSRNQPMPDQLQLLVDPNFVNLIWKKNRDDNFFSLTGEFRSKKVFEFARKNWIQPVSRKKFVNKSLKVSDSFEIVLYPNYFAHHLNSWTSNRCDLRLNFKLPQT